MLRMHNGSAFTDHPGSQPERPWPPALCTRAGQAL